MEPGLELCSQCDGGVVGDDGGGGGGVVGDDSGDGGVVGDDGGDGRLDVVTMKMFDGILLDIVWNSKS